jgi:hypothetical protein
MLKALDFFMECLTKARTLPGYLYRFNKNAAVHESILNHRLGTGVPVNRHLVFLGRKCSDCKGALMGWENLPLVLFIGHGSHSANNPLTSLDCGACAASPGRYTRMLAKKANIPEVRQERESQHWNSSQYHFYWRRTQPLQMRYCFSTQRFRLS